MFVGLEVNATTTTTTVDIPVLQDENLSISNVFKCSVILGVFWLLLCTAVPNIIVLWRYFEDVLSRYLISLSVADLLCALLVVPFSFYSSLRPTWKFGGDNSIACNFTVYAQLVLLTSSLFIFSWISVDRYAAFMKPRVYETVYTLTRCKCWILFSWITSLLLACPVLIAKMETKYSAHLGLCLLNWPSSTLAYSLTLCVLVLFTSISIVVFTGFSIFLALQKPEELDELQRGLLESDENFAISFFLLLSFLLTWLPIIVFQFLPSDLLEQADRSAMEFAFAWLALGGGSSKLLIYSLTSQKFRQSPCLFGRNEEGRTPVAPFSLEAQSAEQTAQLNEVQAESEQHQHPNKNFHPPSMNNTTFSQIVTSRSFISTSFDYGTFGLTAPIPGLFKSTAPTT